MHGQRVRLVNACSETLFYKKSGLTVKWISIKLRSSVIASNTVNFNLVRLVRFVYIPKFRYSNEIVVFDIFRIILMINMD